MKKMALLIAASILALAGCADAEDNREETSATPAATEETVLAGCAQRPDIEPESAAMGGMTSPDDTPVSAAQGGENIDLPLESEALTEPPELTVYTLNHTDSLASSSGNFHWRISLPDGTATEMLACGAHPLDQQDHPILYTAFPAGSLPAPEEGTAIGSMPPVFYLDFGEIPPEIVSAVRWPAAYIGDAQSYSADFETVTAESDGSTIMLLPSGDGDYVYEVSAEWGNFGAPATRSAPCPSYGRIRKAEQIEIAAPLDALEYQPYTCDGLPEYRLTEKYMAKLHDNPFALLVRTYAANHFFEAIA